MRHILFLIICFLPLLSNALVHRSYSATRHDRFTGFPSAPAFNTSAYFTSTLYTGVGWSVSDTGKQIVLVSPYHLLFANHYGMSVGENIRFLNKDGVVKTYSVASSVNVPDIDNSASDVILVTLQNPVLATDAIDTLPYYKLTPENQYVNKTLVVFGKNAKAGKGVIKTVTDVTAPSPIDTIHVSTFEYKLVGGGTSADDCYFETGDSGSPSFCVIGGKPALVGTHSLVSTTSNPYVNHDSFIPQLVPNINLLMETKGYHMKEVTPLNTNLVGALVAPSTIMRSAHAGSVTVDLTNSGTNAANNLSCIFTFPAGTAPTSITATNWICTQTNSTTWTCLRGGQAASVTSPFTLTWSALPASGTYTFTLDGDSDESAQAHQIFSFDILPSYLEWANSYSVGAETADSDSDCNTNLLEYAFGKNPTLFDSAVTLTKSEDAITLSYPERSDATTRALTYQVQYSSDLINWTTTAPNNATITTATIDTSFLSRSITLSTDQNRHFMRVLVTINE